MAADLTSISELLAEDLVGWLTTVSPQGQPQSSLVWFLQDGDELLIYSKPNKPKLRNIAANPRVSFLLHSDRYGHRIVSMEGTARMVHDPVPAHQAPAYIEKYQERIDGYGWTPESFSEEYSVLIRVAVERLRTRV